MGRVIIVRHAQSEANVQGVGLGRSDSPLTDLGRRQAQALGLALARQDITRVIASPLQRAALTAQAIADHHGLTVETDDCLTEMDVGELEGIAWDELRERYADFLREWSADDTATIKMPGGESLADVQARAWPLLAPLLDAPASGTDANPGAGADQGATVVVSHNFVIRVLLCRALDIGLNRWRRFEVDLTGRSVLDVLRGHVVLRSFNDVSHLSADLQP